MIVTTFSLLLNRCGLSQREAAEFLHASPSHIDKASRGKYAGPAVRRQVAELQELYRAIERAADETIADIEALDDPDAIVELGYAADDYEAQELGWPYAGAHRAVIGIVASRLIGREVHVVPRGSTSATVVAIASHR